MTGAADVDVLVPTRDRPDALAVTLAGLAAQSVTGFRVVVSDQSEREPAISAPAVQAMLRVLRQRGCAVRTGRHLPARGLAEHRAHLLSQARAPYLLTLDDDVWLEPDALATLLEAIGELRCGFVGMSVIGLSYAADVRPHEHAAYEAWDGPVRPERVRKGTPGWERWRLHNAANPLHLAGRRGLRSGWSAYKVAWVAACVLYDRAALLDCGGFDFWTDVGEPAHCGEDVVAQLRVMERYGGAGLLPSRAYHLELPTTVPDRRVDCYDVVLGPGSPAGLTDRGQTGDNRDNGGPGPSPVRAPAAPAD
ncbi:MAG: glycosyltransferase family 2 protein [Mycobacteriales bacterium]